MDMPARDRAGTRNRGSFHDLLENGKYDRLRV